jgi:hypothetical protein
LKEVAYHLYADDHVLIAISGKGKGKVAPVLLNNHYTMKTYGEVEL